MNNFPQIVSYFSNHLSKYYRKDQNISKEVMAIRRIKKEEDNIVVSIKGPKKIIKYEKINVKQ